MANGGHNGYGGNEVDALELETNTPTWTQVLAPTSSANYRACSEYYADGRPTSRHTYYGLTFNEFDDRFMLFSGSWSCGNGTPFLGTMDSYNIGSNSYSPAGTHPRLPTGFDTFENAYAPDPSTGNIYVAVNQKLVRWNRSSNTFTTNLGSTGPIPWGDYSMSAFDTSRGRFLVLGGVNKDHHVYTVTTNAWTTVTLTGANAANVTALSQGAMFYVSAIDRYLVRSAAAGSTVYQINPQTFEVTTLTTTGGTSIPSTQNGPFNKFLYVPRLGGAVYVPTYSGNSWFLRLH